MPSDCRLTATKSHLLLISEARAQVELRNLVDGSLEHVVSLPPWWTDASENSGSSVYTFQPEEGEDLRWRIAVVDGHCLVYRRNTKAAALESHNLSTNKQAWSIPLPADSLVSNIVNGHVAVLSDTNRLQIYDLYRAALTANTIVPDAKEGTNLYLRNSGGHWVVITDTVEKDEDGIIPFSRAWLSVEWFTRYVRAMAACRGPCPFIDNGCGRCEQLVARCLPQHHC